MFHRIALGCVGWFVISGIGWGEAQDYAKPQLLIDPSELSQLLGDETLIVLDARSETAFEEGHVPGARWVNHADWSKAFQAGEGGESEAWQDRIRDLGIHSDSNVVVYDDAEMKDAARIWWILGYCGAEDARLLNGGWRGWSSGDLPVEQGKKDEAIAKGNFRVMPRTSKLSTKDQLLDSLRGPRFQVVDARSFDEHCGLQPLGNERGGAIPGAKHLEWSDLIDSATHRFRSPMELKQLFAMAGIDLARPTATHCQSGGRASVMAFGLELMGAKEVRNYYRGWSEWGNLSDTPIEKSETRSKP
jgi:thiosulfate/3-mercaptopyruvate sulfurtransferase